MILMTYGKTLLCIITAFVVISLIISQTKETKNQKTINEAKKQSLKDLLVAKKRNTEKTNTLYHPNPTYSTTITLEGEIISKEVMKNKVREIKHGFIFPVKEIRRNNYSLYEDFFQQTGLNNKDTIIEIITTKELLEDL